MAAHINSKRKIRKKRTVVARDGQRCFYCQDEFPLDELTLDHVVPKSRGGTNENENLVLACGPCNWDKGSCYTIWELTITLKRDVE